MIRKLNNKDKDFSCEFPMVISKIELVADSLEGDYFEEIEQAKWVFSNILFDAVNDLRVINNAIYGP